MFFTKKFFNLIFSCTLLCKSQAYSSISFEELPQDIVTHIASFIPMHDVLIDVELVSKVCHERWGHRDVWSQYARSIPGFKRVEIKIALKKIDYKELIQILMVPKVVWLNKTHHSSVCAMSPDGTVVAGTIGAPLTLRRNAVIWNADPSIRFLDTVNKAEWDAIYSQNSNEETFAGQSRKHHYGAIQSIAGNTTITSKGKWFAGKAKDDYGGVVLFWQKKEQDIVNRLDTLNEGKWDIAYALISTGEMFAGQAKDSQSGLLTAVKWRKGQRIEVLEPLGSGAESKVSAISANGEVIIGEMVVGKANKNDFIYTYNFGMKSLTKLLEEGFSKKNGSSVPRGASVINDDGTLIAGTDSTDKDTSAWKAYVPSLDFFKNEGFDLTKVSLKIANTPSSICANPF
jgi:hypothetical protein